MAYTVSYAAVAILALDGLLHVSQWRMGCVLAASVLMISLVIGLLTRVTVEPPRWRHLCRARNVALSAALLFSLLDIGGLIWFMVAFSGWQQ